jgi:RNA polymerase sigma factor (sigma-70 family)
MDNRDHLKRYFEQSGDSLRRSLRQVVWRSGLAVGDEAVRVADELLSDVVEQALMSAGRLKTPEEPFAWVMAIGLNLIKRRFSENTRLNQREPLLYDLHPSDSMTEDELIDMLFPHTVVQERHDEYVEEILSLLSPEDEQLIRLAILYDLNGEELGAVLGITPGAARVRLHRALKRLREAAKEKLDE